ncbi:MAG TPA: hypothetical protein DCE42_09945 [Myxococcales bacterium]|nr:hypothetical protein [Deltaproteobacteria bacterium]HAA55070.1 hypothetical protein [Myxococcales bacterium]
MYSHPKVIAFLLCLSLSMGHHLAHAESPQQQSLTTDMILTRLKMKEEEAKAKQHSYLLPIILTTAGGGFVALGLSMFMASYEASRGVPSDLADTMLFAGIGASIVGLASAGVGIGLFVHVGSKRRPHQENIKKLKRHWFRQLDKWNLQQKQPAKTLTKQSL